MHWRNEAACLDANPVWFDEQDSHTRDDWADLKLTAERYCSDCPVIADCRAYATTNSLSGLYGARYRHRRGGKLKSHTFIHLTTRTQIPLRVAS